MAAAENPGSEEVSRVLRRATYASVATAALLIAAKSAAWLWTGSVSLLASLIDSCMDALASLTNLIAVHYALRPADKEHRFGHGKLEPLAGLGQAVFIIASGLFLLREAVDRLVYPRPLADAAVGIGVMVLAIVVTVALLRLQGRVIRATGSTAIKADALHYRTDLMTNGAVLLALLSYRLLGWHWIDPVFALGIGAYVLYSAWLIAWEAIQLLMDRELPDEERAAITAIVLRHPEVRGVTDLRSRRAGTVTFIQFELKLNGQVTLEEAHRVAEEVKANIRARYGNAQVLIHQEPVP